MMVNHSQKLIDNLWDWQTPVKPDLFYQSDFSIEFNDNLDSYCVIHKKDRQFHFIINNTMEQQNIRFFICYCLAYYYGNLLVNKKESVAYGEFSYDNASFNKRFAMNFSFDLLIPKEAVNYFVFVKGISDISTLAKEFNVSERHLSIQLERLNILPKGFNKISNLHF